MAILLTKENKIIVQGITGYQGLFHAKKIRNYGSNIVGGVTPGKGGTTIDKFPVWDSVAEAKEETGADTSCIFVPARFARNAALEAIDAGMKLVVVITEGVPKIDAIQFIKRGIEKEVTIIGPNCPGLITPGQAKVGIIPTSIVMPGEVGVVSRSGTLTYEILQQLTAQGQGQSTCVGIGGDPFKQSNFVEILERFQNDKLTKKIVLVGEIGGNSEEKAADFIKEYVDKPVIGLIAGKTAKPGKTMGHAGAIIQGGKGTANAKIQALSSVGVRIANKISEIPNLLAEN